MVLLGPALDADDNITVRKQLILDIKCIKDHVKFYFSHYMYTYLVNSKVLVPSFQKELHWSFQSVRMQEIGLPQILALAIRVYNCT